MHKAVSRLALAALFPLAAISAPVHAGDADYPNKPIRVVVGIAPGGGLDSMTRVAAEALSDGLKQTVIVDNRPGAGTVIGMDIAAHAMPDGYTLLSASNTIMLNGVLKRAKYDVRKAFVPIVRLTTQGYMLDVTPSLPVRSVKELIDYAKAHPHALNYGSQGLGSMGHIGMERFKLMAGIDMVHVPYRGASVALVDVIGGRIQLMFASTIASAAHIRNGKLKALAISSAKRSKSYPDVPTIAESGLPGFELTNSYNYFAPAGTPPAIVERINRIISAGMNAPKTERRLEADGSEAAAPATPEEFKREFNKQYDEFAKMIRVAHIKIK